MATAGQGLLNASGQRILLPNGKRALSDGVDECATNDCSGACSTGTTKDRILVTLAGVRAEIDLCLLCNPGANTNSLRIHGPSILNDSQCLTRTISPCEWKAEVPVPSTMRIETFKGAGCQPGSGPPDGFGGFPIAPITKMLWRVVRGISGVSPYWFIEVDAYGPEIRVPDPGGEGTIILDRAAYCEVPIFRGFAQSVASLDCRIGATIANSYRAETENTYFFGGTATLTPGAC